MQRLPSVFWGDLQKMVFTCFFAKVGRQFLKSNEVVCLFCPDFQDFARIFTKTKLLGCACTPCTPAPYTTAPYTTVYQVNLISNVFQRQMHRWKQVGKQCL